MAETEKNSISRLRILYVYKILYENTDEDHKITMPELIELLGKNGMRFHHPNSLRKRSLASLYRNLVRLPASMKQSRCSVRYMLQTESRP